MCPGCGHPLFGPQLEAFVSSPPSLETHRPPPTVEQCLGRFHHFDIPSLAHLFALVTSASADFLPAHASLVVVDDVSIPFAQAFPRLNDAANEGRKRNDVKAWASARRWSVASDFASHMSRLAGLRNVAVVLLSQTVTRVKSQHGAILRPALSSKGWDDSIATRIVLFRDWTDGPTSHVASTSTSTKDDRFFGILKLSGVLFNDVEHIGTWTVAEVGSSAIRTIGR